MLRHLRIVLACSERSIRSAIDCAVQAAVGVRIRPGAVNAECREMEPDELLALVDGYELPHPPEMPMEVQHESVPAVGEPNSFAAPSSHGQPDPQGWTVSGEPAALQPDPAIRALHLRHDHRQQGQGGAGQGAALGWVADPATEASRLDAWVDEVEALHQARPPCSIACRHHTV